MCSGESLMEFVSKRVAAAEEITTNVEKAMVQFEEGLGGQSRPSDMSWKPQSSSHTTELPQHHVWEREKVLTNQQLSNHGSTSSLDQEEPKPPLIKEEQQEPEQQEHCQHKGQLLLKQENVTFMVTSPSEETDCHEPEPNRNQPLCQSFTEPENQDQGGSRKENSELNSNEEQTRNKIHQQTKDHRDSVDGQKLKKYKTAHRGERLFLCELCGKSYSRKCYLIIHMRTHTGEKPYPCKTCSKCFSDHSHLTKHIKIHTGEKSHPCKTCGKCFTDSSSLTKHMRTHTGEKPYPCKSCGKCFSVRYHLNKHMRTHTGEKPFPCKTCGKCFSQSSNLKLHIRTHHK